MGDGAVFGSRPKGSSEVRRERANLVHALRNRVLTHPAIKPCLTIYGSRELIGSKAEELLVKSEAILEAGFEPLQHRSILAMDFFSHFYERNGVLDALRRTDEEEGSLWKVRGCIRNGKFSPEESKIIAQILREYAGVSVVVRSSSFKGDARGTGAYYSEICRNRFTDVADAILTVLESHYSDDAIEFRRKAKLPDGMAVIIEPAVGTYWRENLFAPNLAGCGYTSTSAGEGFVNLVYGLGAEAVQGRGGMKFTESDADMNLWQMHDLLFGDIDDAFLQRAIGESVVVIPKPGDWNYRQDPFAHCSLFNTSNGEIKDSFAGEPFPTAFTPKELFAKMKRLEALCGRPQYIEWAMKIVDGEYKYHIVQIADITPKADWYDFQENPERLLFKGKNVSGSGIRECQDIVIVSGNVEALEEYNKTHKNYVLVYDAPMVGNVFGRMLYFHHISNAALLIEMGSDHHIADPIQHWGGQLEEAGIFFASSAGINGDNLQKYAGPHTYDEMRLEIYPVRVRATSSERQDKMIVEAIPEGE